MKVILDPNDCMTAIIPGVSSSPVAARRYFKRASLAQRQRELRSLRLYLKNTRSIVKGQTKSRGSGLRQVNFYQQSLALIQYPLVHIVSLVSSECVETPQSKDHPGLQPLFEHRNKVSYSQLQ